LSAVIRAIRAKTSRPFILGTFCNGDSINATTMYQNGPVSLLIMEEVCCFKYVNLTYEGFTKREVANRFSLLGNSKRRGYNAVPSLSISGTKNFYVLGQTKLGGGLIRMLNITFTVVR
jgi:hypothetical protein